MSKMIATIYTNVRGKYHDDHAVNVVTAENDADDSHGKAWAALGNFGYVRQHREPRGNFHLPYDPDEVSEATIVRRVSGVLKRHGFIVFRKLSNGDVVDA